jgi:hypothetical protein
MNATCETLPGALRRSNSKHSLTRQHSYTRVEFAQTLTSRLWTDIVMEWTP